MVRIARRNIKKMFTLTISKTRRSRKYGLGIIIILTFIVTPDIGAGGGNRTRVSALGRLHNGRYTTPAYCVMEPPWDSNPDPRFTKAML